MTLEETILEAVRSAPLPLKAGEIAKQTRAQAAKLATPKAVATTLAKLSETGSLHRIAAGTPSKPEPLYTLLEHEAAAAALLKHIIHASKKEQAATKLKAKLPAGLQPHFEAALARLASQGSAFVLPGTKRLVYAHQPGPSALLTAAQRKAVQKILDKANSVRPLPATLDDFIIWLDEGPTPTPASLQAAAPPLDAALLREWYAQDRLRSSTVMIPIPQTYARYEAWALAHSFHPDSQVLRNFMQGLYNNGLVLLEPCERPQDLPAHERAMLVPMSLGPPGWSWCWVD